MTYVVDYSAGKLPTLPNDYSGSVRYVPYGSGSLSKFATVSEVQSQLSQGKSVALVYEQGTADASGGYASGVAAGNAIRNFATSAGMLPQGYLAQDAWLNNGVSSAQLVSYVQGAASVLGWGAVGLYGFIDSHNATASLPIAARWLCGDHVYINNYVFALWQDNNWSGSINGIAVDRNLVYQPNWLQTGSANMALTAQDAALVASAILDLNLDGKGTTLSKVIQNLTLNPATLIASAVLDTQLNASGATLSKTVQDLEKGVVTTVSTATVDQAALTAAVQAAVATLPQVAGVDYAQVQAVAEAAVKAVLGKTQQ